MRWNTKDKVNIVIITLVGICAIWIKEKWE